LGCKVVLLNPAVHAARDLAQHVGLHPSWHDPAQMLEFEAGYVDELRAMQCAGPTRPERYYLLAAKGDEVLDWREMTARYPGVTLRLLEGSDHGIGDFAQHIDDVLRFLDLA
ncbi:MAG TPA: esterase, partial [Thauera sp.]|nr:esterase [Thauera sp.]